MKWSVNESKESFFDINGEFPRWMGCSLICIDFCLRSIDEWRNLFYIVIDAL